MKTAARYRGLWCCSPWCQNTITALNFDNQLTETDTLNTAAALSSGNQLTESGTQNTIAALNFDNHLTDDCRLNTAKERASTPGARGTRGPVLRSPRLPDSVCENAALAAGVVEPPAEMTDDDLSAGVRCRIYVAVPCGA